MNKHYFLAIVMAAVTGIQGSAYSQLHDFRFLRIVNTFSFLQEPGMSATDRRGGEDEFESKQIAGNGFMVYPSPAEGDITFTHRRAQGVNTLTLTDLHGHVVGTWRNVTVSGFTIPRGSVKSGLYLLTFQDAHIKETRRVVFK